MSLSELLIVIAVIGVIAAIALPSVSRLFEASNEAKDRLNAKNLSSMSEILASLGVAHVIPDSLGGIKATARLIREGVIVSEGPMAGERFIMASLHDDDIDGLAQFLKVKYGVTELSLVYSDLP